MLANSLCLPNHSRPKELLLLLDRYPCSSLLQRRSHLVAASSSSELTWIVHKFFTLCPTVTTTSLSIKAPAPGSWEKSEWFRVTKYKRMKRTAWGQAPRWAWNSTSRFVSPRHACISIPRCGVSHILMPTSPCGATSWDVEFPAEAWSSTPSHSL